MPYIAIDPNTIKVGDPITKELLDLIRDNFEAHESLINGLGTTGGSVFIFDGAIHLANFDEDRPDVFYYKATQDFEISDFRAQIYAKGAIVSGILALDLQKSIDTEDANFNTCLTADLQFNFASDADYLEKVAAIDPASNSVVAGEVLRIVVTGLPTGFNDKILVNISGE